MEEERPLSREIAIAVGAIDNAIKLFTLEFDLRVYCGDRLEHFGAVMSGNACRFRYRKYVSTSLYESIAKDFAQRPGSIMLAIDAPKGANCIYIGANSRVCKNNGRNEYELLLAHNTLFEVISIGDNTIHLQVLTDCHTKSNERLN